MLVGGWYDLLIMMLANLDLMVLTLSCLVHLEHFLVYLFIHDVHRLQRLNFHLATDCYELVDLLDIPFNLSGVPLMPFC